MPSLKDSLLSLLFKGGERWAKGSVNTLCFAASSGETIKSYFDFNEYQSIGDVQRGSARPLLLSRKGEPWTSRNFCQSCMPWLVANDKYRGLRQTNGFNEESMASQADGNNRTLLSLLVKGSRWYYPRLIGISTDGSPQTMWTAFTPTRPEQRLLLLSTLTLRVVRSEVPCRLCVLRAVLVAGLGRCTRSTGSTLFLVK